jgi:hypothetical protein
MARKSRQEPKRFWPAEEINETRDKLPATVRQRTAPTKTMVMDVIPRWRQSTRVHAVEKTAIMIGCVQFIRKEKDSTSILANMNAEYDRRD